jgi:hypothetical protein
MPLADPFPVSGAARPQMVFFSITQRPFKQLSVGILCPRARCVRSRSRTLTDCCRTCFGSEQGNVFGTAPDLA